VIEDPKKMMTRAIELARQGMGRTSPNPAVGAVVVVDGEIVAEGYHQKCGAPHAERNALQGRSFPGGTLYVTLEPCSTHGRTGACVDAIIEAGISHCVYAIRDPNPDHAGAADILLKRAGVQVTSGLMGKEANELIRGFRSVQTRQRPWVIAKTAMSLDGRITRPEGEGQWLTGQAARSYVQQLRNEVDVILTGGETIRRDNPSLTVREYDREIQPLRAVMTRQGLSEEFHIFTDAYADRTKIYLGDAPMDVLKSLAQEGHNTILLEAGGTLLGDFSDLDLIDEWVIFLAPMLTGGLKSGVAGKGAESISTAQGLTDVTYRQLGEDVVLRGIVQARLC